MTNESPSGGTTSTRVLGDAMSELAITLQRDYESVEDTLQSITDSTLTLVPSATDVSVSLVIDRRRIQSRAATGSMALEIDRLQDTLAEGPCLDAVWSQPMVEVPDLRTDLRWPRFAPAASERGVRSMLCFQLYTHNDNLGALNLSSSVPDAFDEEAQQTGTLVATHAAVALIAAEHENQMQSALATRDVIGQAKGIVMERYNVNATQAFEMIRKLSQDWNVTVVELAATIADRAS